MRRTAIALACSAGLFGASSIDAHAADGPSGLLLRRGLIRWQMPLQEAQRFVEKDIHPRQLTLLQGQKPYGFACGQEDSSGVTRCDWACCVDLGVKDTVYFANLYFYRQAFYAFEVAFPIAIFDRVFSSTKDRFGSTFNQSRENQISLRGLTLGSGVERYVVTRYRWDLGDSVVLLSDAGGRGNPLTASLHATYLPLARKAAPPKAQEDGGRAKLPF